MKKLKESIASSKLMMVLTFFGLYLLSTGISLAVFSYVNIGPKVAVTGDELDDLRSKIAELPKTEECPVNGAMFTVIERDIWEGRRPIVAMIENHEESRPQSGLSYADVVYETVAEGGITRFAVVFYCDVASDDVNIAPVRSARVYFVDWASEYGNNPIFMHVGGANDYGGTGDTIKAAKALELLETMGWRYAGGNDLDTTYDSGFPVFWRNYERLDRPVATEHTMMASIDAGYEEAKERGFNAKDSDGVAWDEDWENWQFEDGSSSSSPEVDKIKVTFWDNKSDYDVTWEYDSANNQYLRSNGGKPHIDLETDEQLSASNVIVIFTREQTGVDRNKHVLYTTEGSGDALIFKNGEVVEATWEKDSQTSRTTFTDEKGNEIAFVRGPIWIQIVAIGSDIEY